MKQPIIRVKEIDGKKIWTSQSLVHEDKLVCNAPERLFEQEGWKKVIPDAPRIYEGTDVLPEPDAIARLKTNYPESALMLVGTNQGVVYHYSTWEVLFSNIMEKDNIGKGFVKLRAYCVNYMNDTSEHKIMVTRQMNAEEKAMLSKGLQPSPLYERRKEIWKWNAEQGKNNWFATCFSKERDSLPMWNYYGFHGRGIAIGFDANVIWNQGFTLYNCIYDENNIEKLASIWYDAMTKQPKEITIAQNDHYCDSASIECLAKDFHFAYEKECRILLRRFYKQDIIKTRRDCFYNVEYGLKGNYIAPYVDYMLPISAVKEIVIGPTNNTSRARQSLESWLEYHELERSIKIYESTAPLATE